MRSITLTCPWAHAVAHWGKNIENRTWRPPRDLFGQRLAIHAGKSPYRQRKDGTRTISDDAEDDMLAALDFAREASGRTLAAPDVTHRWLHERSSAILCVVTVAGWVRDNGEFDVLSTLPGARDLAGSPGPWFVGPCGWVLADVVTLAEPVPCKGAQGLWTVPPDVLAKIDRAATRREGK